MPQATMQLDRVHESMRQPFEQFVSLVQELAGTNNTALTAFGAVVAGAFDRDRHTAKTVLVVDRIDLSMLRALAGHGTKLGKLAISAPLMMTPDYIKSSCDTFPLELIEIKQQHATLFGQDHFDGLEFDDAHVRLQCERELKVTLIGLRQGLLAAAGRDKFISALEVDVCSGVMRTLRGMLWLKGQKEGRPGAEVLAEIEKLTERKLSGVRATLDSSPSQGGSQFDSLYHDVEALGEIVDGW